MRYVAGFDEGPTLELLHVSDSVWEKCEHSLKSFPTYYQEFEDGRIRVWPMPVAGCKVYKLVEIEL